MARLDTTALTLGPTAASVRRQVSRKQWHHLVGLAHKKGYAVDSFLNPNIPAPLKQRTPKFLRAQALSTVKTAYEPVYKELDQRETRVKALSDKRASDNQYYLNWLNTQHQALVGGAQAADQALEGTVKTLQTNTGAAYDQAKTAAQQQLAQLPGTVSDFSDASAFGQIDAHKASAVGQVGATGQQALAQTGTAQGMRELANANNFATIAALESKRVGDTWGALQDIGSDRLKLNSQQAQDVSKQIQDALAQELTKAQSNRDFDALAQKLDIQQQGVIGQNQSRRSAARLNKKKFGLAEAVLKERERYHNQLVNAKGEAVNAKSENDAANFAAKWGVSKGTFLGWSDAERQGYLKRARDRGIISGGGKGGAKGTTKVTQGNFNKAYAKLFGGSRDVPGPKDPKTQKPTTKTIKFDPHYAQKNYNELVNMLVAGGFDTEVADAAVHAFIQSGANGHPGSLNRWLKQIKDSKGPGGAH